MTQAPASRAQGSDTLPLRLFLLFLLLTYGAIAGLRTVADFDLGWQMAESRHPLTSTDTLSYTAHGAPWIYPPLAGYIFRGLFHVAGYTAISWFCAAAVLLTLATIAAGNSLPTILLALLATPLLASQMIPRSGLFTIVLAAAFTRLLLSWHLRARLRTLWPLPFLMIAWVNLHTGFIAGIGLMLGYLTMEILELLSPARQAQALRRLRQSAPWLAATAACTLVNPWGPRIYTAIAAQEHISRLQASLIEELQPLYRSFSLSSTLFNSGNNLRFSIALVDPLNTVWLLLALALLCVALLLRQQRIGLAVFLACSVVACLLSSRSQGVFASIACLVSGEVFTRLPPVRQFGSRAVLSLISLTCLALVAWRCTNIVTDKTSLREQQITLFGAGPSWWLPQHAADFIDSNHLPTQLFSTFNLSSYLTWRLGPYYPDFADGRYLPFGDELVAEQLQLPALPLDSPEWQQAAARYNIRTIVFPLSRFFSTAGLPLLDDCRSRTWSPVYLDTQAVIFVRNDALSLAVPRIDCTTHPLSLPESALSDRLSRMNRYQALANAAVIYFLLKRNAEAQATLTQAQLISLHEKFDDQSLILLAGQLQLAQGNTAAAEQSFHQALSIEESDAAWYWLGMLHANQHRYPEAVTAMRNAARLSAPHNYQMEWTLARLEVLAGQQQEALSTLAVARRTILYPGRGGARARAQLDDTAAVAYSQLAQWPSAVASESDAVREAPTASRWHTLAALYSAAGQNAQAAQAQEQAEALSTKEH